MYGARSFAKKMAEKNPFCAYNYYIKEIDSTFPCICTLIDAQMMSKCGENKSHTKDVLINSMNGCLADWLTLLLSIDIYYRTNIYQL